MIKDENEEKIPLLEMLEDSVRKAIVNAKFENRTINQPQYEVLSKTYESISTLFGTEARINLHPAFASGGISIVVESIKLDSDKLFKLSKTLDECSTLSIDSLVNGNIELGVTIPDVFYPIDHKPAE